MSVYSLTAKPQPKLVEEISEESQDIPENSKLQWEIVEVDKEGPGDGNDGESVRLTPLNSRLSASLLADLLGVAPYSEKPLVCVAGEDRPPLVAEYQGSETCGYEQAQKLTELAYGLYHQSCEVPREQLEAHLQEAQSGEGSYDKVAQKYNYRKHVYKVSVNMTTRIPLHPLSDFPVQRPIGSEFKPYYDSDSKETGPITCGDGEFSIPTILHNFDLLNPEAIHPFYNIVFHLNADQLHDFRSAESFKQVAEEMVKDFKVRGIRQLRVTLPGGGSYMTPLVVAFHMIDQGVSDKPWDLDKAEFTFSEIDIHAPQRIEAYLDLMAKMKVKLPGKKKSSPLITHLKKDSKEDAEGRWEKETFTFKYRGKPITLVVLNNPEVEKFIPDDYLKFTNLLILHDMDGHYSEEDRLIKTMEKIHGEQGGSVSSWIVSTLKPESSSPKLNIQEFEGKFGCGYVDSSGRLLGENVWSARGEGEDATLVAGVRKTIDPFEYELSSADVGKIRVHYQQAERAFYLIRWN